MALRIEQDGVEYEFVRWGRVLEDGDYVFSTSGVLYQAVGTSGSEAIFRPKPKLHTFGGVVFEETGEVRRILRNEWGWSSDTNNPVVGGYADKLAFRIVRPVAIEEE